jgi:hypothetical protein
LYQAPTLVRAKVPKLAALEDEDEADVLAFIGFPKDSDPQVGVIHAIPSRGQ